MLPPIKTANHDKTSYHENQRSCGVTNCCIKWDLDNMIFNRAHNFDFIFYILSDKNIYFYIKEGGGQASCF